MASRPIGNLSVGALWVLTETRFHRNQNRGVGMEQNIVGYESVSADRREMTVAVPFD